MGFKEKKQDKKHLLTERANATTYLRESDTDKQDCTYDQIGIISKLCFSWVLKFVYKIYKGTFDEKNLPPTSQSTTTAHCLDGFERSLHSKSCSKDVKRWNFVWEFFLAQTKEILLWLVVLLFAVSTQVGVFLLLTKLMDEKMNGFNLSAYHPLMFCTIVLLQFLEIVKSCNSRLHLRVVAMKFKTTFTAMLYKKILLLDSKHWSNIKPGHIITLISTDLEKVNEVIEDTALLVCGVLVLIVFYGISGLGFGLSVLPSVALILMYCLAQYAATHYIGKLSLKQTFQTDSRVSLMNEIICSIRVIKMYCWEEACSKRAEELRKNEMDTQIKRSMLSALVLSSNYIVTKWIVYVIVFTHVFRGGEIQSKDCALLVGLLKLVIFTFLYGTASSFLFWHEVMRSAGRINDFLHATECCPKFIECDEPKVEVNATASWAPTDKGSDDFILKNINLTVNKAQLIGIVGKVGSGKTSILRMLLGEMHLDSGSHDIRGSVSYVPQEPWIISKSVRDNIIMENKFKKDWYQTVISHCCLDQDLLLFPAGDCTMVGERGLTLSGGQKARISLARAIYRDADVYLLDDPLSAVDGEVAQNIFADCIRGLLKNKLRILVTHQLQFLPKMDYIYLLHKGCIIKSGRHENIEKDVKDYVDEEEDRESSCVDHSVEDLLQSDVSPKHQRGIVVSDLSESKRKVDNNEIGSVSFKVYLNYIHAGKGWIFLPIFATLIVCSMITSLGFDWTISTWNSRIHHPPAIQAIQTNNTSIVNTFIHKIWNGNYQDGEHLEFLGILLAILTLTSSMAFMTLMLFTAKASKNVYNSMFEHVLKAPTYFFDCTPVGQILNRFSRDTSFMDSNLTQMLIVTVISVVFVVGIDLLYVCLVNQYAIIIFAVTLFVCAAFFSFFMPALRETKRMEAGLRSDIFSHISSTMDGVHSIRAMDMTEAYTREASLYIDEHTSAWFLNLQAIYCLRFYSMAVVCIATSASLALLLLSLQHGNSSLDSVRLALIYLVTIPGHLQFCFRQSSLIEICMTSVERIQQYSGLEQEGLDEGRYEPPKDWPQKGNIEFNNMVLTYHQQPPVLGPINLKIFPREKIGIIGRTGAGKSSLFRSLLRMADVNGDIIIDDVLTKSISLKQLRSSLSVIPQDPVLFNGTFRHNLDPFNEYSDENIWSVLEKVELKSKVNSFSKGLTADMGDTGINLSLGEKQLLCLARAILKENKIVLIDEATANVDKRTDSIIQRTLQRCLTHATVLTIAHRLNTVIDSDKIMVMDNGKLVEYGSPAELLNNESGIFHHMLSSQGTQSLNLYRSHLSKVEVYR